MKSILTASSSKRRFLRDISKSNSNQIVRLLCIDRFCVVGKKQAMDKYLKDLEMEKKKQMIKDFEER